VPQALPVQAPEPASASITLHASAQPRSARLFLDGKRLAHNPATLTVRRDDRLHELRAEAPGFVASLMQTRFVEDAHLTLELRRERSTKRRTQRRAQREPRTQSMQPKLSREPARATHHAPAPARVDTSARSIDTESPFR
jgi:hypothetical protein